MAKRRRSRYLPLLLTLVPLIAAVGLYWLLWSGWARELKTEVAAWLPGSSVGVGGFPYRIEADVDAPKLTWGRGVVITANAAAARINRGPWQPDLTVISTTQPRFTAAAGGPASPLRVDAAGLSALSSVHITDGKLARLSTVIEAVRAHIGLLTPSISADSLQVHVREVPGRTNEAWSATLPERGQAVLSAERLRIGTRDHWGDALTLAANIAVTGKTRLTDYARWADGGTIEVRSLVLSDAHGEVARGAATLVPDGAGVRLAGTIDTVCPEAVVAAFDGSASTHALRLRAPVRLTLEAAIGAVRTVRVTGLPADLAARARLAQLPPCPVLRGR